MKRHHRRHSRYLLIVLGMVGLIFWHRQMIGVLWNEGIGFIDQTEDVSDDNTPSSRIIIGGTGVSDVATSTDYQTFIVIGKGSGNVDMPSSQININQERPSESDILDHQAQEQDNQADSVSGSIGGASASVVGSGQMIPLWRPFRTLRKRKQFAYELANALELDTNKNLTTINGYYDTQTLYDAWNQTQDPQLYSALVNRLINEYRYNDAIEILESHTQYRKSGDADRYINALRESKKVNVNDPDTIQVVQDTLDRMTKTQALTPGQVRSYQHLIDTRNNGVDTLIADLGALDNSSLRTDLYDVVAYYETQPHVPVYYRDALVAMVLVQYEYFTLAEKIALDVMSQDQAYVLPWQILGYSSFTKRDWGDTITYLDELEKRDPDNKELYTFLRGIIGYRQGDYVSAALTLRQTQEPRYLPDAVRYLILAYDHLDDEKQRNQAFTSLLQYTLTPSDYYTYFYLTLFQPFQEGVTDPTIVDNDTTQEYIRRCLSSLIEDARVVCEYGAVGALLVSGALDRAYNTLVDLYDRYPYSYLAHALGDYYTSQGNKKQAMRYYFLAMRSTNSSTEHDLTKQKIRQLNQPIRE